MRKGLQRKLKRIKESKNIEVKVVTDVEAIADDVYGLYLNTYLEGAVRFEKLTRDFFANIGRALPAQVKYFLYYSEGKLISFNLCFAYMDKLIDAYLGFDYGVARKYNLYYFSWCYNIEWCLKNAFRYYQPGRLNYHIKMRLGGRGIPLYSYVRHNNFLVNLTLKLASVFFEPKTSIRT
jgi:predicted N-acyltransferase